MSLSAPTRARNVRGGALMRTDGVCGRGRAGRAGRAERETLRSVRSVECDGIVKSRGTRGTRGSAGSAKRAARRRLRARRFDHADLGLDERLGAKTAPKTSKTAMPTWPK